MTKLGEIITKIGPIHIHDDCLKFRYNTIIINTSDKSLIEDNAEVLVQIINQAFSAGVKHQQNRIKDVLGINQ